MKFFLALLIIVFLIIQANAQNSSGMPTTTNIGIGTTSPENKIHIKGLNEYLLKLEGDDITGLIMKTSSSSKQMGIHFTTDGSSGLSTNSLRVGRYDAAGVWEANPILVDMDGPDGSFVLNGAGNIGLGILEPEARLDLHTNTPYDGIRLKYTNTGWVRFNPNSLMAGAWNSITKTGDAGILFGGNSSQSSGTMATFGFVIAPWHNGLTGFRMDADGRVGIGTNNTSDQNFNLFVENGIRTRKVKVDQSTWADYVFDENYPILSLKEVEVFIRKYKHLPGIPSADEVTSQGLDLGETEAALLKKIEEMTLYIIEQEKRLDKQQAELSNLYRIVETLVQKNE